MGYIADQSPLFNGVRYFADFLHHDTPAFTGPERLSRMLHAAVFYCDVSRPKRGEYLCRYVKMTDDATTLPKFELTRLYYELLEVDTPSAPVLALEPSPLETHAAGFLQLFRRRGGQEAAHAIRLTQLY